jgi:hypothetical protein
VNRVEKETKMQDSSFPDSLTENMEQNSTLTETELEEIEGII